MEIRSIPSWASFPKPPFLGRFNTASTGHSFGGRNLINWNCSKRVIKQEIKILYSNLICFFPPGLIQSLLRFAACWMKPYWMSVTRNNGIKGGKFCLNSRKSFTTLRSIKPQSWLPRGVVKSFSQEMFKWRIEPQPFARGWKNWSLATVCGCRLWFLGIAWT